MTNDQNNQNNVNNRNYGAKMPGGARAAAPSRPASARPAAQSATRGTAVVAATPPTNKKRTAIIVIAALVAVVAIWLLIWLFACNGSSLFDPNAQTGQAPYKTDEEMQAELDRQVEEGMFNISIASVIEFDNGSSSGTAYIENVPGNLYNMQVTITDDESGNVLYESGILQPNQYIADITLTTPLSAGTYPATATFSAIDPTTYEEIGQAAAKVTLNVLN